MSITEHGYVIQWRDGSLQVDTFESNRNACWQHLVLPGEDFKRLRNDWKKSGARCVPATRTIQTGESE